VQRGALAGETGERREDRREKIGETEVRREKIGETDERWKRRTGRGRA
jgi:hypothetical protein